MKSLVRAVGLFTSITSLWICCSSTAPDTTKLEISLESAALKAGERVVLSLKVTGTVVPTNEITWISDHPEICVVNAAGEVLALQVGRSLVTASVGRQSARTAISVVPAVDGTWAGHQRLLSVQRVSGEGPFRAELYDRSVQTYQLVVMQQHGTVNAAASGKGALNGELTGLVDADGRVDLTSTQRDADSIDWSTQWTAQLDEGGQLTGGFVMIARYSNAYGPQVVRFENQILDLARN